MNSKINYLFFTLSFLTTAFLTGGCQKTNTLTPDKGTITWQQTTLDSVQIIAMTVSPNGEIFASTCGELYRSSDQGESWVSLGRWCPRYLAVNEDGKIFLTGASGGARSYDNGASWESFYVRVSNINTLVRPLVFGQAGEIYIGSLTSDESRGGIYRSLDNGETWMQTNFPDTVGVWALAINSNAHLFAGTGYGLFRSIDEGLSWKILNVGFELDYGPIVDAIAIDKNDNEIFVGIEDGGVYRSSDKGESWKKTGLAKRAIVSLLISPVNSKYIFAGSRSHPQYDTNGVFYTANQGESWVQINSGLTDLRVVQLAGDALGFIYVATENSGVFRTVNPINK